MNGTIKRITAAVLLLIEAALIALIIYRLESGLPGQYISQLIIAALVLFLVLCVVTRHHDEDRDERSPDEERMSKR